MEIKKKLQKFILLLLFIFPTIVFAYSDYIIPGGENIGIKVNTKYVSLVGFYKVNDEYIGEAAGFKVGDSILTVEDEAVNSINSMIKLVDKYKNKENIAVKILRDNKEKTLELSLQVDDDGTYKTGLYVKDQINGIGTLTYIDPNTKIYGALGHEISDKMTLKKVEIRSGTIFKSLVTGIKPSKDGTPGEKQAKFYSDDIFGNVKTNEESGIFGTFTDDFSESNAVKVGKPEDVKLGKATIRTVISGSEIKEYEIEIIEINKNTTTKNILFKITNQELLDQTGGVVAGMSGSPIMQNDKLIGAVTHVVVNDADKGYGIFITTMLEEGER